MLRGFILIGNVGTLSKILVCSKKTMIDDESFFFKDTLQPKSIDNR